MNELHRRLSELCGELRQRGGYDDIVRWIQAGIKKEIDAGRRRQSRRTVELLDSAGRPMRGGRFRIPADVLADAEILE